jgi:flagellar biogenesis protein FliO
LRDHAIIEHTDPQFFPVLVACVVATGLIIAACYVVDRLHTAVNHLFGTGK